MKELPEINQTKAQKIKEIILVMEQIDIASIELLTRDANTLLTRQKMDADPRQPPLNCA